LGSNYPSASAYENIQVERSRPALRFVHAKVAPDDRVMFVQSRSDEAFRPGFRYFVFLPQFFDSLETAFYDSHHAPDVFRPLALNPWL
jgi:hypothetical protein